jgi:hypothetical protein
MLTAPSNGRLVKFTAFTASATWTKDPRTTSVFVEVKGGGGGGGGVSSAAAIMAGGGGGEGGISKRYVSAPGATETVHGWFRRHGWRQHRRPRRNRGNVLFRRLVLGDRRPRGPWRDRKRHRFWKSRRGRVWWRPQSKRRSGQLRYREQRNLDARNGQWRRTRRRARIANFGTGGNAGAKGGGGGGAMTTGSAAFAGGLGGGGYVGVWEYSG